MRDRQTATVRDRQTETVFFKNHTVCPGSSDPIYIVTFFIKWVTTSWTDSIHELVGIFHYDLFRVCESTKVIFEMGVQICAPFSRDILI